MSRPILFDIKSKKIIEFSSFKLEKNLQAIVEENMEKIFSIKFLATEYSFSNEEGNGRIDSLGLDSDGRPVVIEYKLSQNQNIINQALFYINWIKNHRGDFELLVLEKLGIDYKNKIDWDAGPRAICIAEQFYKYDSGAVQQMNANIELYQYYLYGYDKEIIGFERVNQINEQNKNNRSNFVAEQQTIERKRDYEKYENVYKSLNDDLKKLLKYIKEKIIEISDDVSYSELSRYAIFKRNKNFVSVVLNKSIIKLYLSLDFKKEYTNKYEIRDVTNVGHWGTGNILIEISKEEDFDKNFDLIKIAYDRN